MVRINLLPHEIVERRKWERWYPLVFLVSAIALAVVLAVILGLFLLVQNQRTILQNTQNESQRLQTQAGQFAVFEDREAAFKQRQVIAEAALAGRINWAQVCNDISLILPDEVWTNSMAAAPGTNGTQLTMTCTTPSMDPSSPEEGYKSVARTLVRLGSLPELFDVWLGSATSSTLQLTPTLLAPTVDFQVTTHVKAPASTQPSSTAVSAPPSTTGQ